MLWLLGGNNLVVKMSTKQCLFAKPYKHNKAVLSQRWPRKTPHIWVPWKFSGLWLRAYHADYSCMCTRFPTTFNWSFGCGLRTSNVGKGLGIGGRGWYRPKEHWRVPIGAPYILFLYQYLFAQNFRLQSWVGVANPQSWGRGGLRGRDSTVQKSVGQFL